MLSQFWQIWSCKSQTRQKLELSIQSQQNNVSNPLVTQHMILRVNSDWLSSLHTCRPPWRPFRSLWCRRGPSGRWWGRRGRCPGRTRWPWRCGGGRPAAASRGIWPGTIGFELSLWIWSKLSAWVIYQISQDSDMDLYNSDDQGVKWRQGLLAQYLKNNAQYLYSGPGYLDRNIQETPENCPSIQPNLYRPY